MPMCQGHDSRGASVAHVVPRKWAALWTCEGLSLETCEVSVNRKGPQTVTTTKCTCGYLNGYSHKPNVVQTHLYR